MKRPGCKDLLRGFLIALVWFYPALAQHEIKTVDGLKVMLAVAGVEDIKKYPEKHPEVKMHGGPGGSHHVLIHIEEEKTGKAISNVSVSANVHNPDGTNVKKVLEPMTIGGITDFGNYFDIKELGNYHIDVLITVEGEIIKVNFSYERRPWH